MMDSIARLQTARRYVTEVLLNLDVSGHDLTVASFLELLDHFYNNPDEYRDYINSTRPDIDA